MKQLSFVKKGLCCLLSAQLVACSTVPSQYASSPKKDETIRLAPCFVSFPKSSPGHSYGVSYWNQPCENGVANGTGLAVWQNDSNKPVARYTGTVAKGTIDTFISSGVYVDNNGRFKGRISNGDFIVGEYEFPNGDKFEGSFDVGGGFRDGVLRKSDGVVIAGHFQGRTPVGDFYYKDATGKWYGTMVNGKIVKRAPLPARPMSPGEMIGAAVVVALGGALVVTMVMATGALLVGGAAIGAMGAARVGLLIIVV